MEILIESGNLDNSWSGSHRDKRQTFEQQLTAFTMRGGYNVRMATLRRILKYTPAVVLGLLAVAWASLSGRLGFAINLGQRSGYLGFYNRSFRFSLYANYFVPDHSSSFTLERIGDYGWLIAVPIVLLQTAILPLAVGALISFRFRLWHYLAYTALVAVELAYYLRW